MKLLTLDGNSIINRAFYGIRPLNASDGTPTNAIYGFLNILQRLIADESPDALCVTFDFPALTFRHERYEDYKAHRKPMPEELRVQLPLLKEILAAMNILCIEQPGWEADDLLGTIGKKCEEKGIECVIVSGDKDTLQLVSDFTRVNLVKTSKGQTETISYTPKVFLDEYGFTPDLMIDLKALMGDSSDNIPGVAGVGEKTALDLVRRFGGIDRIYASLDTLDIRDSVKKKLEEGRGRAEISYMLATIRIDAPVEMDPIKAMRSEPDNDKLYEIFKRLDFVRMIQSYGLKQPSGDGNSERNITSADVVIVVSEDEAMLIVTAAKNASYVAVDLDIEFFDSIAVAFPKGQPLMQRHGYAALCTDQLEFANGSENDCSVYELRRHLTGGYDTALMALLSDSVCKAAHNVKDIIKACLDCGIETGAWVFDTALAAYLIAPTDSHYDIERLSEQYCNYELGVEEQKEQIEPGQISVFNENGKQLAQRALAIGWLRDSLSEKLAEVELEKLFYEIEVPLCRVLAEMEQKGFFVDKDALKMYGMSLSKGIDETAKQIYEYAGESFNINSPKQLGTILFEKLRLPAPKKTKTGYSTNVEVLDSLANKHPIIGHIKDYRELSKLKSTYVDGLLKVIGPNGRIHTHFQMTVTATGRLSSTEPNLQNIPVRKETGEEIRKMFIAGEGNVLIDADYSQIELRVLAHIAKDAVMIAAFQRGDDIHSVTASQVFAVPLGDVTTEQRSRAKAVNFGIVYGITSFSLANDIGVLPREAKAYMDNYLAKYSGVREYMANIVEKAKALGYVDTLYGRRRYLPELKSSNFNTRAFGERVALNMPIQGTAADIIKIAMINATKRFIAEEMTGRLILQVHDELIAECPEQEAEAISLILREEMENAAKLLVPLVADTRIGKSWYDVK